MDRICVMTKSNVLALLAKRKFRTMRVINDYGLQMIDFEKESKVMYSPPHKHEDRWYYEIQTEVDDTAHIQLKPRYQVGDRLLVAEGYRIFGSNKSGNGTPRLVWGQYLADKKFFREQLTEHEWKLWLNRKFPYRPTSGRFMYKSLARISMVVTAVTVQRPQDLTNEEAFAEGCTAYDDREYWKEDPMGAVVLADTPRDEFQTLWNSIHKDGWQKNEWCFVTHWKEIEVK